jgi:hypothetical protein
MVALGGSIESEIRDFDFGPRWGGGELRLYFIRKTAVEGICQNLKATPS